MNTYSQKTSEIKRNWHLVDAKGQVLGRLASDVAKKLIGKHKPTYTPHIDAGDFIVVINAEQIEVTGNKREKKLYRWHTGFIGGLKEMNFAQMQQRNPEKIIEQAVSNMLPKNKLRNERMKRLKVYVGSEHPHDNHFKSIKTQVPNIKQTQKDK